MAKQILVDLVFNANTTQAKAQMKSLQADLQSISSTMNKQISMQGMNSELQKTSQTVNSLRANLSSAFNVDTGKLDLTKFNQNMKSSGMSLKQYRTELASLGPEGRAAFNQLATSIMQSEVPLRKANTLIDSMMATLGNTLKWSIASQGIQMVSSGISEAMQYAKDLNESLSNIRIVTGYGVDEMSKFAEQANKAAKALSTSTTAFTDAALIYYQQGLEGDAVLQRAETTVKLANVVGESAETVSEWMTAVWNNFYDGSEKLEYYADVMTKLGAATASSADEIAGGLEKFAAVADTVGLSYEYAASAVATITAQTRQSEDVVGTALKTIFARIQDLDLGKTLEDGTDLGQYSAALKTIGVDVKDANGKLKGMNLILDEMGAKWKQLEKDEQVAMAKSVAGIRQYAQLIALMDNYDTFKLNVDIAEMSDGALQEQQDIWAESWEAASKRVEASAQGIYQSLIDDEFFIGLNNVFADLLGGLDSLIESMGGLKTILPFLIGGMLSLFGPKTISMIKSYTAGLTGATEVQRKKAVATREEVLEQQRLMEINAGSTSSETTNTLYKAKLDFLKQIENIERNLNENQLAELQYEKDHLKVLEDQTLELLEQQKIAEQQATIASKDLRTAKADVNTAKKEALALGASENDVKEIAENFNNVGNAQKTVDSIIEQGGDLSKEQRMSNMQTLREDPIIAQKIKDLGFNGNVKGANADSYKELVEALKEVDLIGEQAEKSIEKFGNEESETSQKIEELIRALEKEQQAIKNKNKAQKDSITAANNAKEAADKYAEAAENSGKNVEKITKVPFSEKLIKTAGAVGMLTGGLSSLSSGFSGLVAEMKEGTLTFGSFIGYISSIAMAIPMMIGGFQSLTTAIAGNTVATTLNEIAQKKLTGAEAAQYLVKKLNITAEQADQILAKKGIAQQLAMALAIKTKSLSDKSETGGIWAKVVAKTAELAVSYPLLAVTLAIVAATALLAGGVAIIKAIADAYNADAIAAENAAKHAKEVGDRYNEVKQAYDDLKASIEDYHDAQSAINNLKEGTVEWKQAILDANNQVLDLIDKYPVLLGYVENLNGRLTIKDEGFQTALEKQESDMFKLSAIKQSADIKAREAKLKSDKTDLLRDELDSYNFTAALENTMLWTANGMMVDIASGGATGGAGTIGGLITGIGDSIIDNATFGEQSENLLSDLEALYAQQGNSIFKDFEETLDNLNVPAGQLRDTFLEQEKVIKKQLQEEKELTLLKERQAQLEVDNFLAAGGFSSQNYGAGVQDYIREQYQKEKDALLDSNNKNYNKKRYNAEAYSVNIGLWSEGVQAGEDAFKEYAETMGYDEFKATNFKEDRVIFKTRKEGESDWKEDQEVSYDDIIEVLQQNDMEKKRNDLIESANRATSTISNLEASTKAKDQVAASFLENGDLSLLDPETFNELADGTKKFVSEETAKAFGKTAEEVNDEIAKAIADYDPVKAAQKIAQQKAAQAEATIASGAKELEISEGALEAYADELQRVNSELANEEAIAAELAVQHYKLAKGIKNLRDTFNKYSKVLATGKKDSFDYYEAIGALQKQLQKTFGQDVSTDFVQKNLQNIQKLSAGGEQAEEALKSLRKELLKDFVINLNLSEEAETNLQNQLNELVDKSNGLEIGAKLTLDDKDAIASMNEALATGQTTVAELENAFANAGLKLPEPKTKKVPQVTKSKAVTKYLKGPQAGTSFETETETTTYSDLMYFGDKEPQIDEKTGEFTSFGGGGSVGVTKTGGVNSLSGIGDYDTGGAEGNAEKAKDKKKDLGDEFDVYHKIDKTLESYERRLNRISQAKDKAFGKSKITLMKQETAELEKQAKAQDKKNKIAKQETLKYGKKAAGWGAEFDKNGNISNYNEMWKANKQAYLDAIAANPNDTSKADEAWEQFKNDISKYEKSRAEYEKGLLESQQKRDEVLQNKLETAAYEVEYKIEFNEDQINDLEFILKGFQDLKFNSAEEIANYKTQTEKLYENYETNRKGLRNTLLAGNEDKKDQIDQFMATGDSKYLQGLKLTDEQRKQAQEQMAAMQSDVEAMEEMRQTVHDSYRQEFQEYIEEIEKQRSTIEHGMSVIEHFQNISDLTGMSNDTAFKRSMRGAAQDATKAAMDTDLATWEGTKAAYADAVEHLEQARKDGDAAAIAQWEKSVETMQSEMQNAEDQYLGSVASHLERVKENFKAEITDLFKEQEEALFGMSFDQYSDQFNKQAMLDDQYLAEYEKQYELTKLTRDLTQQIADIDNTSGQRALNKLLEKANKYKTDSVKLSENDLRYLQLEIDLEKARIAMIEAQNNKSIVRLQQDSQGNMGYVYTADQDNLSQATQNYEDKLYALAQFNEQVVDNNTKSMLELQKEFREAIENIDTTVFNTTELYEKEVARITEFYRDRMSFFTDETNKALANSATVVDLYGDQYERVFGTEGIGITGSVQKTFDLLTTGGLISGNGLLGDITESFRTMITDIEEAISPLDSILNSEENSGRKSLEDFKNSVQNYLTGKGGVVDQVNTARDAVAGPGGLAEKLSTDLPKTSAAVAGWERTFSEKIKNAREETEDLNDALDDFIGKKLKTKTPTVKPKGTDKLNKLNEALEEFEDFSENGEKYRRVVSEFVTDYGDDPTATGLKGLLKTTSSGIQKIAGSKGYQYAKLNDKWYKATSLNYEGSLEIGKGATVRGKEYTDRMAPQDTTDETYESTSNWGMPKNLTSSITQIKFKHKQGEVKKEKQGSLEGLKYYNSSANVLYIQPGDSKFWYKADDFKIKPDDIDGSTYYSLPAGTQKYIKLFDTGGYTGNWNSSDGRLAVLHQKELVLNAQDTSNMLDIISITRDLANDMNQLSFLQDILKLNLASKINNSNSSVNQNVTIYADFPSVSESLEIQKAFDNLLGKTTQHINKL